MTDKELDDLLRSHKYGDLSSDEAATQINQSIQERVKEAYDAGSRDKTNQILGWAKRYKIETKEFVMPREVLSQLSKEQN
jgi:hypothetical protein